MIKYLSPVKLYCLSSLILTLAIAACGHTPDNEEVKNSVNDSLQANVNTKNVKATVADGAVTLTGTCEGDNCVTKTGEKIKNINGVKTVQNNVSMTPQTTDLTLRTQVQDITAKYAGVQAEVTNGAVVLRGSIEKNLLQPLMSELNTLQAKKIDNQLTVK